MLFAQITDTHISTPNPSFFAGRSPSKQLEQIIARLNTQPVAPEFRE